MQWLFSFSSFFAGGGHELYVKVLLRTLGRGGGGAMLGGGGFERKKGGWSGVPAVTMRTF